VVSSALTVDHFGELKD